MKNPTDLFAGGGITLGNAKIAEGTDPGRIQITAAFDFGIGEKLYSKNIIDDISLTACAVQAAGTTAVYSLFIDATGAVTTVKGTEQVTGSEFPLSWGVAPDNTAMFGYIKVVNATDPFTARTTDLSASGVTATYVNVMGQPSFTLQA